MIWRRCCEGGTRRLTASHHALRLAATPKHARKGTGYRTAVPERAERLRVPLGDP